MSSIKNDHGNNNKNTNPLTKVVFAYRVIRFAANIHKDPVIPIALCQVTSSFDDAVRNFNCAAECWRPTSTSSSSSSSIIPSPNVQKLLCNAAASDKTLWILKQLILAGCHAEYLSKSDETRFNIYSLAVAVHYAVLPDEGERSEKCLDFLLNEVRVSDELNISVVVEEEKLDDEKILKGDTNDVSSSMRVKVIGQPDDLISPQIKKSLRKVNPNIRSPGLVPPLVVAATNYDFKTVKKLVRHVISTSSTSSSSVPSKDLLASLVNHDYSRGTPLEVVCSTNFITNVSFRRSLPVSVVYKERNEIIRYLVEECQADVRLSRDAQVGLVWIAAKGSNKEESLFPDTKETVVEILLRKGAPWRAATTNTKIQEHQPIHFACAVGAFRAARAILRAAKIHFQIDEENFVPESSAAAAKIKKVRQEQQQSKQNDGNDDDGFDGNNNNCDGDEESTARKNQFPTIVPENEWERRVGEYRKHCLEARSRTDGATPLHLAAMHRHPEVVRLLVVEERARMHIGDLQRNIPLHCALDDDECSDSQYEVVKILLENGANVVLKNGKGKTPGDLFVEKSKIWNEYSNSDSCDVPEVCRLRKLLRDYGAL